MRPDRQQRGFTLIELLLAMGISAMIALLAYIGVDSALQAGSRMEAEVDQLQHLQRTFTLLEEDLLQFRNRPVTDAFGSLQPALQGGSYTSPVLMLTRGGWPNPATLPRSDQQRVQYRLDDTRLVREYWSSIDVSDTTVTPVSTVLLDSVEAVEVEFLPSVRANLPADMVSLNSPFGGWQDYWNSQVQTAPGLPVLPLAIKLSLNIQGIGKVQRVFQLPE